MRAAAGCCCNGSMNDTTYAYDAGGAAGPGTNGSDSYGSNPYGSPAPGPQPKPKRQSDRFFSWIRGSAMERGDDRWIAGVCSAIAQRVGWSPTLVRALVLASVVLCGFGLALYAIAWALLPDARDGRILGEELIDGPWCRTPTGGMADTGRAAASAVPAVPAILRTAHTGADGRPRHTPMTVRTRESRRPMPARLAH